MFALKLMLIFTFWLIFTAQYSFPYVLKRIAVKDRQTMELSPIEVALDEMQSKISELEDVVLAQVIDVKKLQLRLQGSGETLNEKPVKFEAIKCFFNFTTQ